MYVLEMTTVFQLTDHHGYREYTYLSKVSPKR